MKAIDDSSQQSAEFGICQLAVVIVNYFTSEMVRDCVGSLDPKVVRSVVIVDNSNDADEVATLREIAFDGGKVHVVVQGSNVGFGAGVNLGIQQLAMDQRTAVWVLNPDIVVMAGCEVELLKELNRKSVGIVSPLITYGENRSKTWYGGGSIDESNGRAEHWGHDSLVIDQSVSPRLVSFMCGAAPLFSPAALEKLVGFREDLFLYWEDVELSLRAKDLHIPMEVIPSALVWHHVGGASGESGLSQAFYYYSQRNRMVVMLERSGWKSVLAGRGLLETLRRFLSPLRNEKSDRLRKFYRGGRGLMAGVRLSIG